MTFTGVALLLIFVALLACYIPACRAMRVDPIVALRHEQQERLLAFVLAFAAGKIAISSRAPVTLIKAACVLDPARLKDLDRVNGRSRGVIRTLQSQRRRA